MKRKISKYLGEVSDISYKEVLIRNINSLDYPHPKDLESFRTKPRWRFFRFYGHLRADHLAFVVSEHYAWIKESEKKWDALEYFDITRKNNLHHIYGPDETDDDQSEEYARRYWLTNITEEERGFLRVIGLIHYDQVVLIDDLGDYFNEAPHLLVDFPSNEELFKEYITILVKGYGINERHWRPEEMSRIQLFPKIIPEISLEDFSKDLEEKGSP